MRRSALSADDEPQLGALRGEVREILTLDGTALHVEVDEPEDLDSSDVTIIFCHGYALTHDSWHYQREHLRGSARLVFYDQRSHGRSQKASDASHHIDQLGRDLAAVIDASAPSGPIILVGHSMGGMSVMAYADQNPEAFGSRIRGVALVATTAGNVQANSLGLPVRWARSCSRGHHPLRSSWQSESTGSTVGRIAT